MKMISKRFSFSKAVVALFFIVFFVYGCLVMKDYGISVDEIPERNSSLVVYKYLVPAVADIKTDTVDFPNVAPLHEWKDRYYGVAMQLPMVAVEHLFGFRLPMRQVLLIRHIYIYLLFFYCIDFFLQDDKTLHRPHWVSTSRHIDLHFMPQDTCGLLSQYKRFIVFISFYGKFIQCSVVFG